MLFHTLVTLKTTAKSANSNTSRCQNLSSLNNRKLNTKGQRKQIKIQAHCITVKHEQRCRLVNMIPYIPARYDTF